ncbi:ChbG/HpnK family deacetylase [Achromobacter xylosoxidans]
MASADRAGHAQRHSTQGNVQGPCDRRAGRAALGRDAARDGLRTNRRMLGVYGFEGGRRHYADLLQNWLVNACDGDLLMCHPAKDSSGDCAMSRQRRAEYEVLACPKMGEWLRTNGVRIARLDAARH